MRTLAICGSRRGEGCSTVTLCIAKSAAAAGLRIGILDADLFSDGLAEMLGLEVDCNWTEAAVEAAAIHEQGVQVLDQAITLFPMSRTQRQSTAKLTTAQLALIPQIAEQFDLLIVDCGVFNEGALAQTLAAKVNMDAALVVRDLRHTSSRSVHVTVSQIRDTGIEAVGIAENFGAR
jgi:Mrp family chromosome partitioning ATPase